MPPLRVSDLFDPSKYFNEEMANKILALSTETTTNSSGTVVNTFEALETPELRSVRDELGATIPVFAIGPLHKLTSNGDRSSLLDQDRSCIVAGHEGARICAICEFWECGHGEPG